MESNSQKIGRPSEQDSKEQKAPKVSVQEERLFEEDYAIYADRGPNCIDWADPLK